MSPVRPEPLDHRSARPSTRWPRCCSPRDGLLLPIQASDSRGPAAVDRPEPDGFARALKPPTDGAWSLDHRQCRSSDIRKDQTHQNHLAEVVSGWTNVRRRHAGFPISSGLTPSSIPPLDEGQINHRNTDEDEESSGCDLQSLVERERRRTVQGLRSSGFRRRCDPTPPWRWRS